MTESDWESFRQSKNKQYDAEKKRYPFWTDIISLRDLGLNTGSFHFLFFFQIFIIILANAHQPGMYGLILYLVVQNDTITPHGLHAGSGHPSEMAADPICDLNEEG